MGVPSTAARLKAALKAITQSHPRLIATSPHPAGSSSKQASVAILIRLAPAHPPPSTASVGTSPATSPFTVNIPLPPSQPSPPSSPARSPSPSSHAAPPSSASSSIFPTPSVVAQLDEFFSLPWVQDPSTTCEILYIKRASHRGPNRWGGHVAMPGGKRDPDDESTEYTAIRECWEEVGIDLAEKEWISIGQLDDREITTSLGKRLLMVLSPFVFLHTSPYTPIPELQEDEVASAHWIPLELLHPPASKYGSVEIDIATRLAPRSKVARSVLQLLMGKMDFKCILLPNDPVATGDPLEIPPGELPELRLWGLTLGMTLDLLSHMSLAATSPDLSTYPYGVSALDRPPSPVSSSSTAKSKQTPFAPSFDASIFPRFSHPDINILIYLFSFRYRRLLRHPAKRGSSSSSSSGSANSYGRVDWAGMQSGVFYAAVRKALVVAVLLRATAALGSLATVAWWLRKRWVGRVVAKRLL